MNANGLLAAATVGAAMVAMLQAVTLIFLRRLLTEHDQVRKDVRALREAWAAKFGERLDNKGGA